MKCIRLPILLLLLLPSATALADGGDTVPTLEGLRLVASEQIESPVTERRALLDRAVSGSPRERRAILETIEGADDAVIVAIDALGSDDVLVRTAGIGLLVRCGSLSENVLTSMIATVPAAGGAPPVPRLQRALAEVRRAAIEREFLATWRLDDGSFHGMFAHLRKHGPLAARVLTAIALDRRIEGDEMLDFGPYTWHWRPDGTRERSAVRHRAIDALADCGDEIARVTLRGSLRRAPATRLFDGWDSDPIPAAVDDAMRHTIAALGDAKPLKELVDTIRDASNQRNNFWQTVEGSREASALITLARASKDPAERRRHFDDAYEHLVSAIDSRSRNGMLANDSTDYFNLACVMAQRDAEGDREQAMRHLERSVEIAPVSADWFARDGDLTNLRGMPRFGELLEKIRARERALELDDR
jgi:hypothetical protein